MNQLLAFFAALLMLVAITSPLVAQGPSSTTTEMSQHHAMQGMKGSDGMMSGKGGMGSGGMSCPMMGGGMGMGMMMGMMVLLALFWIAAIFALVALGLFLLRRSRTPVAS